jgi:hypothetical protein
MVALVRRSSPSAVPTELLRLSGGVLRDHDVNEGGAPVAHRLLEGAAQVFRVFVFDREVLATDGLHHLVVAFYDGPQSDLIRSRL